MQKKQKNKFQQNTFNLLWKILITFSLGISLFNLSISFNLFNIDKILVGNSVAYNSITDNSITNNSTIENQVKNNIGSNITISKTVQVLSNNLPYTQYIKNNNKINYHYIIYEDQYGNRFFLKDFPFNVTIAYADCNEYITNCVIYTAYQLDNNKNTEPCFVFSSHRLIDKNWIGNITTLSRFLRVPTECIDFNISIS